MNSIYAQEQQGADSSFHPYLKSYPIINMKSNRYFSIWLEIISGRTETVASGETEIGHLIKLANLVMCKYGEKVTEINKKPK